MRKITRRQFLKSSTGALSSAVVLPYLVPSSALGRGGSVAPSERIIMGGIGLGGQGTRDMRNFMTCADVQFIAVCDVDPQRRNKTKAVVDENYGNKDCAAYNDFRELLGRDDIDAVLSATGERWHALRRTLACADFYLRREGRQRHLLRKTDVTDYHRGPSSS